MGIRIPKNLIKECGLSGDLQLQGIPGGLVVRPLSKARSGWDQAFTEMAERGDDKGLVLGAEKASSWDRAEWKW